MNIQKHIYEETESAINRINESDIKSIVTLYGSARLGEGTEAYEDAKTFSKLLAEVTPKNEYIIATGGGPSVMLAGNKGSYEANKPSIGYGIKLEFETDLNEYVTEELKFYFKYFSSRKVLLLKRSIAIIAFCGGYGTLDEIFNTLTLISTGKIRKIPVILYNEELWKDIINFDRLLKMGVISQKDIDLIKFCNTPEEAVEYILSI